MPLTVCTVVAGEIVPIGKETDRHWEQGEDPSLADYKLTEFRKHSRILVADADLIKKAKEIGVRRTMRKSRLSQKAVYAILNGQPVRRHTLSGFENALNLFR